MKTMKQALFLLSCLFLLAACDPTPFLSLEKESLEFSAMGGSQSVAVTANNEWHVMVDDTDSYYQVSPMEGDGNGTITVTVNPNSSSSRRSFQVAVICLSHDTSVTRVLTVSQQRLE